MYCRKWPGRFWVTKKIHAGWRFLVNYQSHSWRWLTPWLLATLSHFREGYFICMTFFLVSYINCTIDYYAIMCNYGPLSSCKIWTFYGYQQYTCIICSFRKYYWIMTSGHLNANISRTKNFTLPVFGFVVAKTLSLYLGQRSGKNHINSWSRSR